MVRVKKIEESLTESECDAVRRLNFQLTGENREVNYPPYSGGTMFLAEDSGVVGMVTLCLYDAPSGKKAWIEDFVVETSIRGKGVGKMLMDAALEYARSEGAQKVMLTSRPARIAAHRFYEKYGFKQRDTDVFSFEIHQK